MKIQCLILEIYCVLALGTLLLAEIVHDIKPRRTIDQNSKLAKSNSCYMLEKTIISVNNSLCEFVIKGKDGPLGSSVTLNITGESDAIDTFDIQFEKTPENSDTESTIYVVLKANRTLDYIAKKSYTFDITGDTVETQTVVVDVYQAPLWTDDIASIYQIEEEQGNTNFSLSVQVGGGHPDTTLNISTVSGGKPFGWTTYLDDNTFYIKVPNLDRETKSSYVLQVKAWYLEEPYGETERQILILVKDIDDNIPKIYAGNTSLEITVPENSALVTTNIKISDADEVLNSAYTVSLVVPNSLQSAFNLSSSAGTGEERFDIIIYPENLNYSDEMWSNFQIELRTQGVKNASHTDRLPITVALYKQDASGSASVVVASASFFATCALLVVKLVITALLL